MREKRLGLSYLIAVSLALLLADIAHAQLDQLARGIPESANVIVIADAQKILASNLAKRDNWKQHHMQLYIYGQTSIPPNTNLMIAASELDFEFVEARWQVAMLDVSRSPNLDAIAVQQKGRREFVSDKSAVALPNDSYLIEFAPNRYGSMAPASLQSVSRWVKKSEGKNGPTLSPFLMGVYRYAKRGIVDAVMAIDLENAIPVADVRDRLDHSDSKYLQSPLLDKQKLSEVLASIRGVMLGVNFDEDEDGTIIIDFAKDISMMRPFAKPMLMKVLADYGAYIDDFQSWKPVSTNNPKRITLKGKLSTTGLRRIMTLVNVPAAPTEIASLQPPQVNPKVDRKGQQDQATQRYYKAIQSYLDEFRMKKDHAKTMGEAAMWLDKYARRINRLPLTDTYDEVLTYGQFVANSLRNAAMAYKGVGMKKRAAGINAANQAQPTYQAYQYSGHRYGRYGWYGGGAYSQNRYGEQRARVLERTRLRSEGAQSAQTIIQAIYDEEGKIRVFMAKKYHLEL